MTRDEVMAMTDEELRIKAAELVGWAELPEPMCAKQGLAVTNLYSQTYFYWQKGDEYAEDIPDYPNDIAAAWELFESIYVKGGKIKGGAWVLGTVHGGLDCAHACLMWKEKGFTKFRPLKVEVTRRRGEMARAITDAWVCAMMGVSDETV